MSSRLARYLDARGGLEALQAIAARLLGIAEAGGPDSARAEALFDAMVADLDAGEGESHAEARAFLEDRGEGALPGKGSVG